MVVHKIMDIDLMQRQMRNSVDTVQVCRVQLVWGYGGMQ
jgi:hypothetical protein